MFRAIGNAAWWAATGVYCVALILIVRHDIQNLTDLSAVSTRVTSLQAARDDVFLIRDFALPRYLLEESRGIGVRGGAGRQLTLVYAADCFRCPAVSDQWTKVVTDTAWTPQDHIVTVSLGEATLPGPLTAAIEKSGATSERLNASDPGRFMVHTGIYGAPATVVSSRGGEVMVLLTGWIDDKGMTDLTHTLKDPAARAKATDLALNTVELPGSDIVSDEDCRQLDHDSLRIVDRESEGWAIADTSGTVQLADTKGDAELTLRLARSATHVCYVEWMTPQKDVQMKQTAARGFQYWRPRALSLEPAAVEPGVQCMSYSADDVRMVRLGQPMPTLDNWGLTINGSLLAAVGGDANATILWRLAITHSSLCNIGGQNRRGDSRLYMATYWR